MRFTTAKSDWVKVGACTMNESCVAILRNRRVAGLTLTEFKYPSELKLPEHSHKNAFLGLVLRGAYTERYRNRSITFTTASVAFYPPFEQHATHFHQIGGHIFRIELEPIWIQRLSEYSSAIGEPADVGKGSVGLLAVKVFKEFRRMDDLSPLAIEGLVLELMAETSRATKLCNGKPPRWLKEVIDFLHVSFTERLMTRDIADTVDVHPVHLARTFRAYYGCTVGDYVRKLRIDYAREQLSTSDLPLVEIALASGFCAQSHFSYLFKRETGLTPVEYRAAFLTAKSG